MKYQTICKLLESSLDEKYQSLDYIFGEGNYTLNVVGQTEIVMVSVLPWISSEFKFSEGPCEELKNLDFDIDVLKMDNVIVTKYFKEAVAKIKKITPYNYKTVTITVLEKEMDTLTSFINLIDNTHPIDIQIVTSTDIFDCNKLQSIMPLLKTLPSSNIRINFGSRIVGPVQLRNCEFITKLPKGHIIEFFHDDEPIMKRFHVLIYNFLGNRNINKFIDEMIDAGYEDWL